ncbi:Quinone oxidoreductase [Caballeronia sordidicola]|uniref:Quinone oxidoreductase n=2 Tax=Caballeronia sordidicola TaxID=196367 RepID=A0A242M5X4_CABSO|nr:Quinone oxidoreductase [Caballeronia sordidicola]
MKAVRIFEYGSPEVLRYGDYEQPSVGPHDVKVKVLATTISRFDIKYRLGLLSSVALPGRKGFPMPMQLGRDAAGIVEAIGSDVTAFRVGDRVVGLTSPANPMSAMSMMGLGNLSTDIDLPGHTMYGSNAQFVARPESYWLPLGDDVSMVDAAAAMWAYATAHRALINRLNAQIGDTLLIIGASGGMGSATLDLANKMGIRTIVTTRSPNSVSYLNECGASDVIVIGPKTNLAEKIGVLVGKLGLDAAIDYSGDAAMLRLCVDVLRPGGRLAVIAGEQNRDPMPINVEDCIRLELNIYGCRGSNISDQQAVVKLLGEKKIKPAVAAVMKLSEISIAHEMLENGNVNGRIVLEPWA